jgi:broad-specificity NMP kinase
MAGPATARQRELANLHSLKSRGIISRWRPRKPGLEIALLGVDGAGKTSVANGFRRLTCSVKVIAMGSAHFRCLPMLQRFVPSAVVQLAAHCERMLRRWLGFCLGCFGWIVIYDRHPLEQINTRPSLLKDRINNYCFHLYDRRVDLTFWLTGDCQQIYERKKEFTPERLRSLDEKISDVLAYCHIDHLKVNVTDNSLDDVVDIIVRQVSARHEAGSQAQVETPPAV